MKLPSAIAAASLLLLSPCGTHATDLPARTPATAAETQVQPHADMLTVSWHVRLDCLPAAGQGWLAMQRSAATSSQGPHLQLVFCLPLPSVSSSRK